MNLNEAFKELEILEEDTFNIQDSKDVEELGSLLNDDDTNEVVNIIDADAMEKNDLENSYAGKVILECDVCHSLCYKEPEEVVIEEDTVIDIECPYCYSNDGFKVIGKVCSFDDCNKDDEDDTDNLENDDDEKSEENKDETADESIKESVTVNTDDVIINDNGCDDNFIEGVCWRLSENGVKFKFSRNNEAIDVDDSVVISLDQEYITDDKVANGVYKEVLAPYENGASNDSDALAVAMSKSSGDTTIFCGKKYYGDYLDRMPTSTESAIGKDKNTAQVTLCFAKDSISPYSVGDNITSALGKYAVYKSENLDVDLLFRAGAECNSAWGLAEKFGCSVEDVRSYNDIESPELNQAVLNPAIKGMKAFSGHVKVVDGTKTDNITFGN